MEEITLNFIFEQIEIKIQCQKNEYMREIFKKFAIKIGKDINNLYFLANGNKVNEELKLEEIKNLKIILVYEFKEKKRDNNVKKLSNEIICPICFESSIMNFEEYKIKLNQCDKRHQISNIFLNEFGDMQMINESKLLCNNCNKSKLEISYNKLYKCCNCLINLCPLCKAKHIKNNTDHLIIDYELKNYLCNKHGEKYISYCKDCYKNLCDICLSEHKDHELTFLIEEISKSQVKDNLEEFKIIINNFRNDIEMDEVNDIYNNIIIYYNICKNIVDNYDIKKKNNQLLSNMININKYSEYIKKDMEKIIYEKRKDYKIKYIKDIYEKIIFSNEITIKYIIGNEEDIRIFGDRFVNKNKDNFKIIFDNKIIELNPFFNLNNKKFMNDILELKLIKIKDVEDISHMFSECSTLLDLPDITKFNIGNIINISCLFYNCSSLESLPDISNWDTKNIRDMSGIFKGCSSLKSLPDISKWNTSNLWNISCIFSNCSSLESLPDISNWDTKNIKDMSGIFKGCSSLKSLPDILKWNTSSLIYYGDIFNNCPSLTKLPDISKWINRTEKDVCCKAIFPDCIKIKNDFNEIIKLIKHNEELEQEEEEEEFVNINGLIAIKPTKELIDGKSFQSHKYNDGYIDVIISKIKNRNKKIEKEDNIYNLYTSDRLEILLKQKIEIPENSAINKILEISKQFSEALFFGISKENMEYDISFKNLEINILLDCSWSISDNEKYFFIIQISALAMVFESLEIPYLIALVGDSRFKVVFKELEEEYSIDNLQKILDCIFIKRNRTKLFSCISTAINKFKTLNINNQRVFFFFTNGLFEDLSSYKYWKENIFSNPNHSFGFFFQSNYIPRPKYEFFDDIWCKFIQFCKSNNLKVELFKMEFDNNFIEINYNIIQDYIKFLLNILKRDIKMDINNNVKDIFEIEKCQNIQLTNYLFYLNNIISDNSLSELNENVYIKKIKLPKDKDIHEIELNNKEIKEIEKNIGSTMKLKIQIKDEEKSQIKKFVKLFKIEKERIINLSSLEALFKQKILIQEILSNENLNIDINKSKENIKDENINCRVTVIIDSSSSCFSPLCSNHTWSTLQILFSALGEIDIPLFNLIVTGNPNPYIICLEKNTLEIFSEKSQVWPILFDLLGKNNKQTDLASAINSVIKYHNYHKLKNSLNPEFLYIITDGLFSLSEKKRIIKNVNLCVNERINVIGVGVGIAPFGIENLFPNIVYSRNPNKLIPGLVSWDFWNTDFNLYMRDPFIKICLNNDDIINYQKYPVYKDLKEELINIPVEVEAFK